MSTLSSIFRYYLSKDKTQRGEDAKHLLKFVYGCATQGREHVVLSQFIMRSNRHNQGRPHMHNTEAMPVADMLRVFAAVANKYGGK